MKPAKAIDQARIADTYDEAIHHVRPAKEVLSMFVRGSREVRENGLDAPYPESAAKFQVEYCTEPCQVG